MEDLTRLEALARQVKDSSKCDIGQTFPRPVLDALTNFRADFTAVIKSGQPVERSDYAAKVTAPCMNACPSHVDIPAYIEQIRFGRWDKALETVQARLPHARLHRSGLRPGPASSNCRRGKLDEPIAIKPLKRFAADQELAAGVDPSWTPGEDKQAKVAIIGAGPAGLACAYYLGLRGYKSTVFETLKEPGGMAAVGIPDYRLPRDLLRREAELCCSVGAEIKYGVNIGGGQDDRRSSRPDGYKAIFVGVGAPEASSMPLRGRGRRLHVLSKTGVEFLREVALGNPKPIDGKEDGRHRRRQRGHGLRPNGPTDRFHRRQSGLSAHPGRDAGRPGRDRGSPRGRGNFPLPHSAHRGDGREQQGHRPEMPQDGAGRARRFGPAAAGAHRRFGVCHRSRRGRAGYRPDLRGSIASCPKPATPS